MLHGQPIVKMTPQIVSLSQSDLLVGRTALITGGTSGIGFAIAKAFLISGANVVITSRSQERSQAVAMELQSSFPNAFVLGVMMDHTNTSIFKATFDNIVKSIEGRQIDILVNNAGIDGGWWGEADDNKFSDVLNTNIKGTFFLSEIVSLYMIENKIHGNILNICSSSSLRPADSAYAISKWGLRGFTLGLARNLIKYNIVVNGIAPGPTATPMLKITKDEIARAKSPIGRYIMPEEIANMAVVLTSNMGKSIVGDIVYMTGGAGLITFDDI